MTPVAELALDFSDTGPAFELAEVEPSPTALVSTLPRLRPPLTPERDIVARPRLLEQLDSSGRVTVVCAPAGSGKTSLLRSWVREARLETRAAWLSLGAAERDSQTFWVSVLQALRRTTRGATRVHEATTAHLEAGALIEGLLDDVAALDDHVWLVVDDLDELDGTEALGQFELLLAAAPDALRFALATRRDVSLGLHRVRLNGDLTELRGHDLRFRPDEARALFTAAGVELPDSALADLVDRTEGWAAGLRLAAISLAQHPDPARFVAEFSGSERTVAEYLMAEVLEGLSNPVRELLLQTSILDRVSGPLADCLTGGTGSERVFHELEDANAFVTSLDARRSWFRYHRLFADLLQLELRRATPQAVAPLHHAAARWYEQEGHFTEAIQHAQAGRDWGAAARLLADISFNLILDGRMGEVGALVAGFPDDVVAADAELALVTATVRLLEGDREESAAYVDLAQQLRQSVPPERRRRFELVLAELVLVLARWQADVETALRALPSVEAALAVQPAGDRIHSDAFKAMALLNAGVAELWCSQLDDARHHLDEALSLARRAKQPWLETNCLGHIALAALLTGEPLSAGLQLAEEAAKIAEAHGFAQDGVIGIAMAAGATALVWLGRFDQAQTWLDRADLALHADGEPGTDLVVHYGRGLLCLAQGRLEDAVVALSAAERMQTLLVGSHPLAAAACARRVQTQARLGQLADAQAALEVMSDEAREGPDMRLAAAVVDLAAGEPQRAVDGLRPVVDGAAPGSHPSALAIDASVIEAVAHAELGDTRAMEASLEHALELAEPEGTLLPFIISPVPSTLERLPRHRTAHASLRHTILDVLSGGPAPVQSQAAPLLDELSDAELRVLRFLPSNLRAPEIASELFLSTNTIRTHLRHIYTKLDAHGRAEAVARARELGLLAPVRSIA